MPARRGSFKDVELAMGKIFVVFFQLRLVNVLSKALGVDVIKEKSCSSQP